MQEIDLQKSFHRILLCSFDILLENIMFLLPVYFSCKKKLLCVLFFSAMALGVIQYLFSFTTTNGKLDFCLDDIVFTLKYIKDIKCSILESQTQDKCLENWNKTNEFLSDNQVQNRLSNCSNYFAAISTAAMLPKLETEISLGKNFLRNG